MAETKVDIKNEYESQTWKRGDKLLASDITKMSKTVDTVENALIEINEDVIPAVAAAAKQNADTLTNIQPKINQIDVPQDKTVSQYVDQKVADLVGAAPETLDTLQEIAEALQNNTGVIGALQSIASDNRVRVEQVENKFDTFETEFEQHVTDAPKYTVLGDRKVIQLANNDGLNGTTVSGAGVNLVSVSSNDIVEIGSSQANLNINTAGKITINGTTNEIASKDDLNDCYNTITGETDNKLTLYASKSALETLSNEIDAKIESATAGVAADYATKSMVEQTREVLQTNIDAKLDTTTYNTDQDILKGSVSTKASKEELNAAIETVDQKIDTKVAELQRADATASEFNAATYATIANVNANIASINDTIQANKDSVDQSIETLNNSFTVYQAATNTEFANVRQEFADADAAVAETAATNLAAAVSDIEGELELKAVKSVVDQQFADMQSDVNDALALKADITYVDNGINNLATELTNHKNTADLQFQGITNKFETVEAKITGVQASHTQDIYDLKQFTSEKLNEHIADNNASFDVVNASITSGDQAVKAELQAALDAYKASNDAKLETLATKAEISSVYNYRGSVETYNDLPSNPQKGDVWNVGLDRRGDTGKNYAWDGFAWDDIGGVINLDQYYDKGQVHTYVSEQLVPYAKTEDLPTHLPNENALVITYNGQPLVVYTGEIAITRNIEANLNTVPVAADNLTPAKTYIDQGLAAKVDSDVYQAKVDSIDGIIVTNNQASIDRDTELETKITDLNSTLSADIESAVTESKRYADSIVADTKDILQTDYNQQISDLTTTVVNGLSLKQDASTAFKKETADALYLAIGGKAVDSAKADYATRAESDKDGNVITTTYATKSELTTKVATDIAAAKNELNHSILANTTAISDVNAKANEASSLAAAASANVATETNRATLAEQALQKNIDNEAAARNAADQDILTKLDAETANRKSEDAKLVNQISAETTARVEANTELTNNLNAEISTRESEITRVEGLINAEANTRESSDSALTNTINLLETELKAADSQITTNLNAEINERQLENTNIRNELDSTATTIRQEFAAADATLKSELEAKLAEDLSKVFVYKGTVSTFDQLEAIVDAKIGDVYNVTNSVDGLVSEKNYAWNGTAWDDIGGIIDLSNYYTKGEVDAINAVTNGRIDTTNSQLASETTDRQNAISQVQSTLDATKSDLQSKINITNANLEAEQTARTTADEGLGVRITAVAADLTDEIADREQGDTDAIATSKQYTDEQLTAAKLELNASIDTKVDQTEYDAFEQTTNTNVNKNATDIANLSGEVASYKIANDAAVAARVLQTDFNKKVTEFTGEFAAVRSEFAAANTIMHSMLQNAIDDVDEALTAYKTSNDEVIDNLQAADTALQQAIDDYKASNNAAVASLTETKANKTDVAASEAALQNSINTLQQEVTAYKSTNNDAVAAVDAKADANKALIDGLESSKADKTAVATDIGVVQTALDDYKVANDAAVAAVDEKVDQNKQSIEDLDVAKADKATTVAGYGITDAYTKTEVDDQRTTINQSIEAVDAKADANKALIDGLESNKVDKATTLAGYGITDAYTKQQVDNLVTAVYRLKGTVENIDALPAVDNVVGNVYNVADTGMNYVWTETGWDALGSIVDLSPYAKVDDVNAQLATKVDNTTFETFKTANETAITEQVEQLNNAKADKATTLAGYGIGDAYTKTEIDTTVAKYTTAEQLTTLLAGKTDVTTFNSTIETINAAIDTKANQETTYSKIEVDGLIADVNAAKADKATTIAGYGITDVYTKTEIDDALADYTTTAILDGQLAEKADVTAVNSALDTKADKATTLAGYGITDAYTIATIDGKVADLTTSIDTKADKADSLAGYGITDAYAKSEVDGKVEVLETSIGTKADKATTYTKDEVDNLITAVYRLKGSVGTFDDLPAADNIVGDVYNVTDTGMNYVYTETGWDALGSIVDLSPYAKKTEVEAVDNKFANYTTTTDLNAALALKANAADVYDKAAVDQTVADLEGSIGTKANTADVYNKTEIDEKFADYTTTDDLNVALALKADKSTLDNYATIANVNAALADKANVADVYSKDEVDTKVADVDAKFADYTTTADLNTKLAEKADVTTVQGVDAKFAEYAKIADVETALQAKADVVNVYNKTEVDDKLANVVTTDNSSYQNVVTNASNVVVLKSSIDQLFARIQALETLDIKTIVAKPGASVSQPESDVAYSGNLTSDGTNTASTTAITAKSVQLNNVTTTDNAIAITATNNVVVDNLTTEGSIAKGSAGGRNAGMSIDSNGYVTITGGTWNADNYNAIEVGLNGTAPKGVNIDGLTVNGSLSNNAISIFDWAENATITISNCHFADVSNVVRISNKSNVPATFNFVNCTVDKWETNPAYAGFLLMQDYTSESAEQAATENRFHNIKITFTNCVGPNGVKIVGSGADFNNRDNQWAYIYCDKGGIVEYSEDRWPTIIGV